MDAMTDIDPAFLWETEALRSSPQRIAEGEVETAAGRHGAGRWMTLREASRATEIPVETLRKWARRDTIPTYLTPTAAGTNIRMVDLNGVEARAIALGRRLPGIAEQPQDVAPEPVRRPDPSPAVATPPEPAPDGDTATDAGGTDQAPPPGTMIVPIDAWNKMLNQLGNLHEAGQQLAAARERAAKAETEATFLRERLAELRQDQPPQPTTAVESEPAPAEPPTEKVWQYLLRRVRDRGNT